MRLSKFLKPFFALLTLLFIWQFPSSAQAEIILSPNQCGGSCQGLISNALARDSVVTLQPGVYNITGTINMPAGRTLQGTRTGKYTENSNDAILRLTRYAKYVISAPNSNNVRIQGFSLDGQCDRVFASSYTRGDGPANGPRGIFLGSGKDSFISNMHMRDFCLDGVRTEHANNVTYNGNVIWRMGHEAIYFNYGNGITAFDNDIFIWTNSSVRMAYSTGGDIYRNNIYTGPKQSGWSGSNTGPGIEINETSHVHIHENSIFNVRESGILIFSRSSAAASDIIISNNRISNTGTYNRDNSKSNGDITMGHVSNVRIENNVIERSGTLGAAIMTDSSFGASGAIGGGNDNGSGSFSSNDEICGAYNQETKKWENVGDENHNGYADCADPACECIAPPPLIAPFLGSPIAIIDEGTQRVTGSGKTIALHGGNSRDTDGGTITSYLWSAEGGTPASASTANLEVTFAQPGTYQVTLQVVDNDGMVGKAEMAVIVKDCSGDICDRDGDTFLSLAFGGNDCDDEHASVHPGTQCLSKCLGDNIIQGDCNSEGKCVNERQIAACTGLGDPCKMDACQPQPDGNVHCVTDVTRDLCRGGILPCGKLLNNPDTPYDESAPCTFCTMLLLMQLIIEWMVRMAAFFAVFMITAAGIMYIFGLGSPDQISRARATIKYALIGFAVVLVAWSIINSLLLTAGYINPLGGDWYTACR